MAMPIRHATLLASAIAAFASLTPLSITYAQRTGGRTRATGASELSADSVRALLLARIAQVPGAQVGIAVHDVSSDRTLEINGDQEFHAASTMKVPVMFALFREFESGKLKPAETLHLENRFQSIVDKSDFTLDPKDDSDSTVYAWLGTDVKLRDLAERMITHSSNLATNALIQRLDPARITELTRKFGAKKMMVRRGVEDNKAFAAKLNNTTTAHDLVALFVALDQGKVANEASTKDMLSILEAQAFNDEIPAGLPAGTRVAHKTGSITGVLHDAGLVYPPRRAPYAIAILTADIPDEKVARSLIADCSRIIWQWMRNAPSRR